MPAPNLYIKTINNCLKNLIEELKAAASVQEISVVISREQSGEKFGLEMSDLIIQIKADQATEIQWTGSWVDSIKLNKDLLEKSGFNLLRTRDILRQTGGSLEVQTSETKITGFKACLPLTY